MSLWLQNAEVHSEMMQENILTWQHAGLLNAYKY